MCLEREQIRRVRISVALRLRALDQGDRATRIALLSRYGTSERIVRLWTRARATGVTADEWVASVLREADTST